MYEIKKIKMENSNFAVPARERIRFAKEEKIDYEVTVQHEYVNDLRVLKCVATLNIFDPRIPSFVRTFTGTSAQNVNPVNYNFAYESTETKAIGRAFAAFGIGIDDSYASADEMADVKATPVISTSEEAAEKGAAAVAAVEQSIAPLKKGREWKRPEKTEPVPTQEEVKQVEQSAKQPDIVTEPVKEVQKVEAAQVLEPVLEQDPNSLGYVKPEAQDSSKNEPAQGVGILTNPYDIVVVETVDGKPRPFKEFMKMYQTVLKGGDHAAFEKLSNEIIASMKTGDGVLSDTYPTYEKVMKEAPVGIVNSFLTAYFNSQEK